MRNKKIGEGCGCGKGFTLIELLIVIAIIGLLSTLAIVSLTTAQRKARDAKRLSDTSNIQKAVELYYSDNASYPTAASYAALQTALADYITAIPAAPNATYSYYYISDGTTYVIGSTLEDSSQQGLGQDDDSSYTYAGVSWTSSSSSAAIISGTATNCADPMYCLVP